MRKLLFVLIAFLFIVGCSDDYSEEVESEEPEDVNTNDSEEVEETEIETLAEKDIELNLIDNDDLKIDLLRVAHGRDESADYVSLNIEIENKRDRTFELYIKELKIDGEEVDSLHIWMDDDEIKPSETVTTNINGYEYEEFTVEEHVSGTIIYNDYEGNRNEITFSEYVNE
ncbi:hypothetical protein [Oceanobacillus alkalisoli]|uniref:hypothetical protein n=1 Tax=Oceanobacillus alkalisoli TaxID=2925113 RepID=UPI001F11B1BA|nr:hypothetical protein [Oceanobacillus alkalisoli]MCF3941581.1 hypothetical protein [Oceanobacillus alkalisoli]